jgi:hypothetical protein
MDNANPAVNVPSKGAKLAAVAGFYAVLFTAAGIIGLPVPLGIVFVFFVMAALPFSIGIGVATAMGLRMLARLSDRPASWPFFDAALQTFMVASLLSTGIFVVRFPGWLDEGFPAFRDQVEQQLAPQVTPEERLAFVTALDQFWRSNIESLLGDQPPPTPAIQMQVRETIGKFGEALSGNCQGCDPKISPEEARLLTRLMVATLTSASSFSVPVTGSAAIPVSGATAQVTGATRPATAPAMGTPVTSAK